MPTVICFSSLQGTPCIRELRLRYERQSKLWCPCPVCALRNALGPSFRLRFRMLRLKTEETAEETPVFCVCKQKQEFIATEAIQGSRSIHTNPERQGIFQ